MSAADISGPGSGSPQEQRGSLRRRVLKSAKIVYNNGNSVLDASLQDISETGARIRLLAPAALPEEFELHLADGRKPRVEVAWRNAATLGVRFVDSAAHRDVAGACGGASGAGSPLLDRIAAIERQLAELRRELLEQLRP